MSWLGCIRLFRAFDNPWWRELIGGTLMRFHKEPLLYPSNHWRFRRRVGDQRLSE